MSLQAGTLPHLRLYFVGSSYFCQMNLAKQHIYLMYDIQNRHTHTKIGEVQIRIHKETEMDKWKNPNNYKHHALDIWVEKHTEYFKSDLDAFYTGDLIPSV